MKKATFLALLAILCIGIFALTGCTNHTATSQTLNSETSAAENGVPESVVAGADVVNDTNEDSQASEMPLDSNVLQQPPVETYATVDFVANCGNGFVSPIRVKVGSTITLPSDGFSKERCRLVGFATSCDAMEPTYVLGGNLTVFEDLTLYAVFVDNSATIRLSKNDDALWGEECEYLSEVGATFTLPPCPFSLDYMEFTGWSRNPAAQTPEFAVGDYMYLVGDVQFYPVFKRKQVQLIYQNGTERISQTVDLGSYYLPEMAFHKDGHTFSGYATEPGSEAVIYLPGDTIVFEKDTVLYCIFTRNPYKIQFATEADTPKINPLEGLYGDTVVIPEPEYEKPLHIFAGYAIDSNGPICYKPGDTIQLVENLVLTPIYTLKTHATFTANSSIHTSSDYIAGIDLASKFDVKALADAGYSSFSVTIAFKTEKTKGASQGLLAIHNNRPSSNGSVFDCIGNKVLNWNYGGTAIYKKSFANSSNSFSGSSGYIATSTILDDYALYLTLEAGGEHKLDIKNNSIKITEMVITVEFFQ